MKRFKEIKTKNKEECTAKGNWHETQATPDNQPTQSDLQRKSHKVSLPPKEIPSKHLGDNVKYSVSLSVRVRDRVRVEVFLDGVGFNFRKRFQNSCFDAS